MELVMEKEDHASVAPRYQEAAVTACTASAGAVVFPWCVMLKGAGQTACIAM